MTARPHVLKSRYWEEIQNLITKSGFPIGPVGSPVGHEYGTTATSRARAPPPRASASTPRALRSAHDPSLKLPRLGESKVKLSRKRSISRVVVTKTRPSFASHSPQYIAREVLPASVPTCAVVSCSESRTLHAAATDVHGWVRGALVSVVARRGAAQRWRRKAALAAPTKLHPPRAPRGVEKRRRSAERSANGGAVLATHC